MCIMIRLAGKALKRGFSFLAAFERRLPAVLEAFHVAYRKEGRVKLRQRRIRKITFSSACDGKDFKLLIVITAVGVPALMIGLGWFEQMTGYILGDSQMVLAGNVWMFVGVLIYVTKILLYAYVRHEESAD